MPEFNPYQPPTADVSQLAPPTDFDRGEFVPPRTGMAKAAMAGLAACAVLSVVSVWAYFGQLAQIEAIARGQVDLVAATASDELVQTVSAIGLVALLATAVCFGMWLAGANRTARSVAPGVVSDTPGWSVGWYFVPFANFYKPFRGMKEIWNASAYQADPRHDGETPPVFVAWWTLWILGNVLAQIATRMALGTNNSAQELITATYLQIASEGVSILSALAAIAVVKLVADTQDRLTRANPGGPG